MASAFMIHMRVHTLFFPLKESNRPETCNNGEVEVKFWWVGKWVGLLRKCLGLLSISGMMNQDLLNSCVIVSKLLSRPKILFLYLKSGYNIGNVYLRVIVKTK